MATTKTKICDCLCRACEHTWQAPFDSEGSIENVCPKCTENRVCTLRARYVAEPSELRIDVKAKRIWVQSLQAPIGSEDGVWVYDCEDKIETHCPMDRCGGPFKLSDFVNEDNGERFFVFAVLDSYFPIYDLVCANSWEDAYEAYIDFAADHRHCEIDENDLKDYLDENGEYQGSYASNGKLVDTEAIQGWEATLVRIEV